MKRIIHSLVGLMLLCVIPSQAQDYVLERLNPQINTSAYNEIAPRITKDGSKLYFTRVGYPEFDKTLFENGQDISNTLSEEAYLAKLQSIYSIIAGAPVNNPVQSSFNQDIWVAHNNDGQFDQVSHPGYPINNALPNSISSFGKNDQEMIVINQFVESGGMKKGFSNIFQKENGEWTFPQGMLINNYHNSGADVNMTMSQDGKVIILAMERNDAIGRSDLYISHRQNGNHWSTPKNLGPGVNSPWREGTPHLSEDGKTLYFSSDRGYQSQGGSDIFMQERIGKKWDRWTAPKRFRKPINSTAHDSHPYFCMATGHLYFNSTRNGSNDIYRIQIKEAKPIIPAPPVAKIEEKPMNTYQPIMASIQKTELSLSSTSTPAKVVNLVQELNKPTAMMPLEVGTKVKMESIFFKQSTAQVLHTSYPALDKLSRFLTRQPNIHILISGHTDNRGKESELLKLSRDRAEAIKQFLIVKKKIASNRIETIGQGGHLPITENVTEKGRKKNRRVEIQIIKIGDPTFGRVERFEGERE